MMTLTLNEWYKQADTEYLSDQIESYFRGN